MPARILGGAAEVYFKPTTGQLVIRKIGLNTTSDAWRTKTVPRTVIFAEKMKGKAISSGCKGKKWAPFKSCLRMAGKAAWK